MSKRIAKSVGSNRGRRRSEKRDVFLEGKKTKTCRRAADQVASQLQQVDSRKMGIRVTCVSQISVGISQGKQDAKGPAFPTSCRQPHTPTFFHSTNRKSKHRSEGLVFVETSFCQVSAESHIRSVRPTTSQTSPFALLLQFRNQSA